MIILDLIKFLSPICLSIFTLLLLQYYNTYHYNNTIDYSSSALESINNINILNWDPLVLTIDNYLSESECAELIELSRPNLSRSTVLADEAIDSRRTSDTTWAFKSSNPLIKSITDRVAISTRIPSYRQEPLQVQRYNTGGEYQPHFDWFNEQLMVDQQRQGGQRVASFLIYLNTVQSGGETIFPKLNISINPIVGKALLFYNLHSNNTPNELTLHGGSPVLSGDKWLATKWIRLEKWPWTDSY